MVTLHTAQPGAKGGNTGMIILGLAAAIGLGYYFLVYKPEQEKLEAASKK